MADEKVRASRVIVVLETGGRPAPLLEAAARLAATMGAELRGLLVEDVRLRQAAGLPFMRELGITSARSRPLEPTDVERALRAQEEHLRRALEATAEALSLSWALDVVRGELLSAALAHAGESDFLVLGRSAPLGGAAPRPSEHAQRRGAIAALDDGSEESKRALLAASALAAETDTDLAVLITAEGPETFRKRRTDLGTWLSQQGFAAADYVFVPQNDAGGVARALQALRAVALFWPAAAAREAQNVAVLLGRVSCPVVLIP